MISSNLQQVVRSAAEDFGVNTVWLFGSAVEDVGVPRATSIWPWKACRESGSSISMGGSTSSCPSRWTLSIYPRIRLSLQSSAPRESASMSAEADYLHADNAVGGPHPTGSRRIQAFELTAESV